MSGFGGDGLPTLEDYMRCGCYVGDMEECSCPCHNNNPTMIHVKACCSICSVCDKRIRDGLMRLHFLNRHKDVSYDDLRDAKGDKK